MTGGRRRTHMDGLVAAFVLACTLSFVLGWAIGAAT